MEINLLGTEELKYELAIRGLPIRGTMAQKRSELREALRFEREGRLNPPTTSSFPSESELCLCQAKLYELQRDIQNFDVQNKDRERTRIFTFLTHVEARLNRILPCDNEMQNLKMQLITKCKTMFESLAMVYEGRDPTTVPIRYRELSPLNTQHLPTQNYLSNPPHSLMDMPIEEVQQANQILRERTPVTHDLVELDDSNHRGVSRNDFADNLGSGQGNPPVSSNCPSNRRILVPPPMSPLERPSQIPHREDSTIQASQRPTNITGLPSNHGSVDRENPAFDEVFEPGVQNETVTRTPASANIRGEDNMFPREQQQITHAVSRVGHQSLSERFHDVRNPPPIGCNTNLPRPRASSTHQDEHMSPHAQLSSGRAVLPNQELEYRRDHISFPDHVDFNLPNREVFQQPNPSGEIHRPRPAYWQTHNLNNRTSQVRFPELPSEVSNVANPNFSRRDEQLSHPNGYVDLADRLDNFQFSSLRGSGYTPNVSVGNSSISHDIHRWNLKFNGQSSVNDFLERVEELRRSRGVSKEQLLRSAPELFTREALLWYRTGNFQTWDDLVRQLKDAFQPSDYEYALWDEIRHRTQGSQERVLNFVVAIENLFKRLPSIPDETARLHIIRRNLLPYVQSHLATQQISSIQELIQLSRSIEETQTRIKRFNPPPTNYRNLMEPELAYHRPTYAINTIESPLTYSQCDTDRSNSAQNPIKGNVIPVAPLCWNCKEPGHTFKKCNRPRAKFCYRCGKADVTVRSCTTCTKNVQRGRL